MKGLWVVLQPNIRTSCDIYYKTRDKIALSPSYTADMVIPNDTAFADMFDFGNIDFHEVFIPYKRWASLSRLTEKKRRNSALMQLRFENKFC